MHICRFLGQIEATYFCYTCYVWCMKHMIDMTQPRAMLPAIDMILGRHGTHMRVCMDSFLYTGTLHWRIGSLRSGTCSKLRLRAPASPGRAWPRGTRTAPAPSRSRRWVYIPFQVSWFASSRRLPARHDAVIVLIRPGWIAIIAEREAATTPQKYSAGPSSHTPLGAHPEYTPICARHRVQKRPNRQP